MNKEEFLKSGLVEQYALGLTSPEESRLVEHFLDNYPEVRTKMNGVHKTVEQYAAKYAVPPPKRLKQRILSEIQSEEEDFNFDEADAIPDPPVFVAENPTSSAITTTTSFSKYLFFSLAGIFFIALIVIVMLLWQQQKLKNSNSALSGQLATFQSQYDALQKEKTFTKTILDQIENGDFNIVHLRGQGVAADAHAVVYWNSDRQKVFVKLLHMPTLPEDRQYQIWADVHGTMRSVGLLNYINELQEVQFVEAADSLNITMEPLGGNPQPTVNLLIAKGAVQADMH